MNLTISDALVFLGLLAALMLCVVMAAIYDTAQMYMLVGSVVTMLSYNITQIIKRAKNEDEDKED